MGKTFMDKYSLLHAAVGVVAYFWDVPIRTFTLIHVLFELIENTRVGMKVINTTFKGIWPGGKDFADAHVNSIGDTLFAIAGWMFAQWVSEGIVLGM